MNKNNSIKEINKRIKTKISQPGFNNKGKPTFHQGNDIGILIIHGFDNTPFIMNEYAEYFIKKGFTAEQAKLKVVWENPNIACICSAMPNMTILQANVAAALNKKKLSLRDKQLLDQYAQQTCSGYCAGCSNICEPAVDFRVPISDILRYSMYNNSYGNRDQAISLFNALPTDIKANIFKTDYSKAEEHCPQKIQIGKVLKKAHEDLA